MDLAAVCSPPGKLQLRDLPGKEIRAASKNSVENHYSHCLDSPLLSLPSPAVEGRPELQSILAQGQEEEILPGLVSQEERHGEMARLELNWRELQLSRLGG